MDILATIFNSPSRGGKQGTFDSPQTLPVRKYADSSHVFACEDGALAFGFICAPLTTPSDMLELQVRALLNYEFPANTQVQFISVRSSDLAYFANKKVLVGNADNPTFIDRAVEERNRHYRMMQTQTVGAMATGQLHDLKLIITFKVPARKRNHTEIAASQILSLKADLKALLELARLQPHPLTAADMGEVIGNTLGQGSVDINNPIPFCTEGDIHSGFRSVSCGFDAVVEKDQIKIRGGLVKCLSAKRLPPYCQFGAAFSNSGFFLSDQFRIPGPYLVCANVIIPDYGAEWNRIDVKRHRVEGLRNSPLGKLMPGLDEIRQDLELVCKEMNEGMRPVKLSMHVVVTGKTKDQIDDAERKAKDLWLRSGIELKVDKLVQLPILLNCLPFCGGTGSVPTHARYKTMTARQATTLLPLFGEWKGTGSPDIRLVSRTGQAMCVGLDDTYHNGNVLISGSAGTGKSILVSDIIVSKLCKGDRVWVMEDYSVYKNLCETCGGLFFNYKYDAQDIVDDSEIVQLDAKNLVEDKLLFQMLLSIVGCKSETESMLLLRAVERTHGIHSWQTFVDQIYLKLKEDSELISKQLATSLLEFTSSRRAFSPAPNVTSISKNSDFAVFDFYELRKKPHVRAVAFMKLLWSIVRRKDNSGDGRKDVIVLAEFGDYLLDKRYASFFECVLRCARKYGVSFVVESYGPRDFFSTENGRIVLERFPIQLFLSHSVDNNDLMNYGVGEFEMDLLKSLHTTRTYSEIFVKTPGGCGIGRLYLSDYERLALSQSVVEMERIKLLVDSGMTRLDAIDSVFPVRLKDTDCRDVA